MKAYIVGGWVRDKVLGTDSADRDWVVVGTTAEYLLSQGYCQVGASFPVFLHPQTKEEYALARKEIKTSAGYHGFSVQFDPSVTLEEDLLRRDLTINALAYDPDADKVIDPFGGLKDLSNKILDSVSNAFEEDPLRVVRLARFHAMLPDFTISSELSSQVDKIVSSGEIKSLVIERVIKEFEKAHSSRYCPLVFWKHCFSWSILSDVFSAPDSCLHEFEELYSRYVKQTSCSLTMALALYDISVRATKRGDAQQLISHFSNKVKSDVSLIVDTYLLKKSWSVEAFIKFVNHHRLMHLSRPRSYNFTSFSLPMDNGVAAELITELASFDKGACIDKSSSNSPAEQINLALKGFILNGQFKDFFT